MVPRKLVNILSDTKAPNSLFGGNTDTVKTKNPEITTKALNIIALPECSIVREAVSNLSLEGELTISIFN